MRLVYVFLFNYFVYYFYDDFTVIFMILFIVWTPSGEVSAIYTYFEE